VAPLQRAAAGLLLPSDPNVVPLTGTGEWFSFHRKRCDGAPAGGSMANLIRRNETGSMEPSRLIDPFEMVRDLMRWDPFRELGAVATPSMAFIPSFEVKETREGYVFKADVPGIKEKDLEISLTGNRLTVSGKREEEKRQEEERYFTYERSYGSFSRSFTLPEGVDPEHVQAELRDGVLTLNLAKKPEVKARKIELTVKPGEKAHA
jgi:HSP20 family protein